MGNFEDLGVNKGLLKAVEEMGFTSPTPVQEKAIPYLLKGKKDEQTFFLHKKSD